MPSSLWGDDDDETRGLGQYVRLTHKYWKNYYKLGIYSYLSLWRCNKATEKCAEIITRPAVKYGKNKKIVFPATCYLIWLDIVKLYDIPRDIHGLSPWQQHPRQLQISHNLFTRQIHQGYNSVTPTHTHTHTYTHTCIKGSHTQRHTRQPDAEPASYWLQTMRDISRLLSRSSQHGKYCNAALSLFIPRCLFFHTVFGSLTTSHPPFKQGVKKIICILCSRNLAPDGY